MSFCFFVEEPLPPPPPLSPPPPFLAAAASFFFMPRRRTSGDSRDPRSAASSLTLSRSTASRSSSDAETSSSSGAMPAARKDLEKPSGSATESGTSEGELRASPASPVRRSAARAAMSTSSRFEEEVETSAGGVLKRGGRERAWEKRKMRLSFK